MCLFLTHSQSQRLELPFEWGRRASLEGTHVCVSSHLPNRNVRYRLPAIPKVASLNLAPQAVHFFSFWRCVCVWVCVCATYFPYPVSGLHLSSPVTRITSSRAPRPSPVSGWRKCSQRGATTGLSAEVGRPPQRQLGLSVPATAGDVCFCSFF